MTLLPNKNKSNNPQDKMNEVLKQQFSPYQKGVEKALKESGYQQASEAIQQSQDPIAMAQHIEQTVGLSNQQNNNQPTNQFLPPKNLFTKAQITPEGNVQKAGLLEALLGTSTQTMLDQQEQLAKTQYYKDIGQRKTIEGLSTLSPDQQVQAYSLARKIGGVRGAEKVLPSIIENINQGKTVDQIEDELRFSGQSPEFSGTLRNAAQQIMIGKSSGEQQTAFDTLDDLQNNPDEQKDFIKRMALVNAPVDQKQSIMGKERTIDLLDEIQTDLDTLEKNGINTGFFSGNYENLLGRVGQVKNPEMRRVATKVAVAVINYRRAMTGVQFGQIENKEYKTLFPNINKIGVFNKSAIQGLKEVFGGDVNKFYSQSMGKKNYNELFSKNKTQEVKQSKYMEGQTATNPNTGEKLIYRGGKWQKM